MWHSGAEWLSTCKTVEHTGSLHVTVWSRLAVQIKLLANFLCLPDFRIYRIQIHLAARLAKYLARQKTSGNEASQKFQAARLAGYSPIQFFVSLNVPLWSKLAVYLWHCGAVCISEQPNLPKHIHISKTDQHNKTYKTIGTQLKQPANHNKPKRTTL